MNTKKEAVYKELCEMGKLGIKVKYPKVFLTLEKSNLEKDCLEMNVAQTADYMIEVTK